MTRPFRIQFRGAGYHVTCCGNDHQVIFRDRADRQRFLRLLLQSLSIYGVRLHSYILMPDHFHLLVETPLANLSEFMRHFNIIYTSYYNRRHRRTGHLYQGRYKAIVLEKDAVFAKISRYIHLNPVRTKSWGRVNIREKYRRLVAYPWSSLAGFITQTRKEPMVAYELVLSEYGGDTEAARQAYRQRLIEDMAAGQLIKDQVVGQSVIGGEAFIDWIKKTFPGVEQTWENPALRAQRQNSSRARIEEVIRRRTGKNLTEIGKEKGPLRQVMMDLLYRLGGMTNQQIGRLFGINYSSVSQERKRLRLRQERDGRAGELLQELEAMLKAGG